MSNDREKDAGPVDPAPGVSRRQVLGGLAAAAAWVPLLRIGVGHAQAAPPPPAFPASIGLYQQAWENWAGDIRVEALWTCMPKSADEVVTVVNWARSQGYTVRPRGSMHGWAPLTVLPGTAADAKVVLVDTTQHLTQMEMVSALPQAAVRVQCGVMLETLLGFLEENGCGLTATPAPGDVTIGGVLAVDAHGTGVPAAGEVRQAGHSFGTLSNLILSLTAVVWDKRRGKYVLRRFERAEAHAKALLTHVGRCFVTEVTLRAGPNYNLRCVSYLNIPASELFAAPGSGAERTLASFVEQTGRMEAIWFPFTEYPWFKVWSVCPQRPSASREVSGPYNYTFADNVPREVSDLADQIMSGRGELTPLFTQTEMAAVAAGMTSTQTYDLWGASKNLLLYVKPTTLRVTANGYAIVTARSNIQRVVAEFVSYYQGLLESYRARGQYPVNGPVEIRVTGLDHPAEIGSAGAEAPLLSAVRPVAAHPEWDVAIWLDLLTFPGTPYANDFFREFEAWVFSHYSGDYALVRPEWSKGWAYGSAGAWTDATVLGQRIPQAYAGGSGNAPGWDWALAKLDAFDPHRVFSNEFLERLMPR